MYSIQVGTTQPIFVFLATDDDGTPKTDLTSATVGLALSLGRLGATDVSIGTLTDKAADNTPWADGAIRSLGSNMYSIDGPAAAVASQYPCTFIKGSYTGGRIDGLVHPLVGYDGTVAAVGANTTTPNTVVPDPAGTAAALHSTTDAAIAALNDFNPAVDAVANVTLVGTCTVNTDMRGTDGASIVVSDAAGTVPGLLSTLSTKVDALNGQQPTEAF
jgi:hypothetical protein